MCSPINGYSKVIDLLFLMWFRTSTSDDDYNSTDVGWRPDTLLNCVMVGVFQLIVNSLYETFEDNKGVIRIRISKNNRQHIGQQKKDKQRSTKHTYKTKDRVTRIPLKQGVISGAPEGWTVPDPLVAPVLLI